MADIRVRYGQIEAVKGITLVVDESEIVTLIGANGAGKTTTFRAISGLRKVSSSTLRLEGRTSPTSPGTSVCSWVFVRYQRAVASSPG